MGTDEMDIIKIPKRLYVGYIITVNKAEGKEDFHISKHKKD